MTHLELGEVVACCGEDLSRCPHWGHYLGEIDNVTEAP